MRNLCGYEFMDHTRDGVNDAKQNVFAWHFTPFPVRSGYKAGFPVDNVFYLISIYLSLLRICVFLSVMRKE